MSATAAAPPTPSRGGELTHKQIMTILSGLMLGMFLASLDQMIVSTAIRTIGDDLHGLSVQAWVTTGFLITSTISTPLYGKLSDIYGRKPLFLFAIGTFIIGSALCGLSTSMYMLAAFRALQGIGAGGLMSMALAIMGDIIPPRERARYQGYFMAVFATSSVLGPVVGGFLAGQHQILGVTGWRWIFYVNVPIGILALAVVTRVLKVGHRRLNHRIDWWGALALVVGLVPLLIIAEQGRTWGWGSPAAYACYLVGMLGLAGFVKVEQMMGDEALLPLRIFRNGVFALGSAQSFIVGIGMFGGMASIPLYLQIVKGASPTKAGLLILPMVVGIMGSSLLAGQVTARTGHYRKFPIIGSALLVLGLVLMSRVGADTALWQTDIFMFTFGAGLGMNMQTLVLAMQNAVEPKDMGVATASVTFFRQVGGTLGTAVFLSILFSSAGSHIKSDYAKAATTPAFQAAAHAHPDQLRQITGGTNLNDTSFLRSMDARLAHPFLTGFAGAMDVVFLTGAAVLVIAFVLSWFMKEVPLRTQSGLEAARSAALASDAGAVDPGGATHEPEQVGTTLTG
ncbi:MAG TPA: MDR family MFS transporter [Jatrophihabitantaceae bacterium]|jgi:EmrB/QacA subfamily drug resistance transporter|nr:MDR family MFS transporter [Jatrophihabitantaceae bacterium]